MNDIPQKLEHQRNFKIKRVFVIQIETMTTHLKIY